MQLRVQRYYSYTIPSKTRMKVMQKYTRKTCAARNAAVAPTITSRSNAITSRIMMRAPSAASESKQLHPGPPAHAHRLPSPGTSTPSDVVRRVR